MISALSVEHEPQPQTEQPKVRPTFERAADETMEITKRIYGQRGASYSDTWALENLTTAVSRATLKRFGITLTPEQLRLLLLAALADVKDSRLVGEWLPDSIHDGLAYRSAYCTLRDEWERQQATTVIATPSS